jgi:hypothetical protein
MVDNRLRNLLAELTGSGRRRRWVSEAFAVLECADGSLRSLLGSPSSFFWRRRSVPRRELLS